MQIPKEKRESTAADESLRSEPPAYEAMVSVPSVTLPEPASTGVISQLHARFTSPPTNFVTIFEQNLGVEGSWTINTSLAPPRALLTPMVDPRAIRPNLRLGSQNGSVRANIRLVGKNPDLAILDCSSQNGSVHLSLVSRGSQKVAIKVHTQNGSIQIFLPRDFCGPIDHRTRNGVITFSSAVRSCVTTISSVKGLGKSFIGDWQSPRRDGAMSPNAVISNSFGVVPVWGGDSLEADTVNGSIHFAFVDEPQEPSFITNLLTRFIG